jgi:hypothetical protein
MALFANGVVRARIAHQRFMRIVAGNATQAGVLLPPALAVLQAVRRKAHIEHTHAGEAGANHVLPRSMAGSAEIDLLDGIKVRWI